MYCMHIRSLQYDSLFLVSPPAYFKDTHILGHYLRDFVCAMRLAIAMVFFSATVVGKQRCHLIALEIVQCHSV